MFSDFKHISLFVQQIYDALGIKVNYACYITFIL